MPVGDLRKNIHGQKVVIDSDMRLLKDRSHLKLSRGDFIVTSLNGDTKLDELKLGFEHGRKDTGRDVTKVMIFELLMLGG